MKTGGFAGPQTAYRFPTFLKMPEEHTSLGTLFGETWWSWQNSR